MAEYKDLCQPINWKSSSTVLWKNMIYLGFFSFHFDICIPELTLLPFSPHLSPFGSFTILGFGRTLL